MGSPAHPDPNATRDPRRTPLRVAGLYLLFSLAWIWGSDLILSRLAISDELEFWAGVLKGSGFALLSAGLLYWLVGREVSALSRALGLLRAVADGTTDA